MSARSDLEAALAVALAQWTLLPPRKGTYQRLAKLPAFMVVWAGMQGRGSGWREELQVGVYTGYATDEGAVAEERLITNVRAMLTAIRSTSLVTVGRVATAAEGLPLGDIVYDGALIDVVSADVR